MSDIGNNSNRRQVAAAVSALQDQVGGSVLATEVARITAVEGRALVLENEQDIVAGPTALAHATFLTDALLRKVLAVAAGPNASTVNVAHGITTPSKIIGCVIQLTNGTNHLCFGQGGMLSDTLAHSITVAIAGTNVSLTSGVGGDYSLYAGSIILLYVD